MSISEVALLVPGADDALHGAAGLLARAASSLLWLAAQVLGVDSGLEAEGDVPELPLHV